ncbi:MAG: DMT family transporter [Planctomycetota bacterium]
MADEGARRGKTKHQSVRATAILTVLTLIAFAGNSVLCRLALGNPTIDAAGFTAVRLLTGALALLVLVGVRDRTLLPRWHGSWLSGLVLFGYAIAFSFAYLSLSAGTGALVLFGAVQATMILAGLRAGERPSRVEWAGLLVALCGVVWLVFPGLTAPSPVGTALMALAGVGWGLYSLLGRRANDPLPENAGNFVRALPMVAVVVLLAADRIQLSPRGVLLATASGALASGVGYAIWYAALRGLTATRAAIVQLAVPVLAALGGVVFLSEEITLRLVVAAMLILGGVGAATASRR